MIAFLSTLAALSIVLNLWQFIAGRRFRFQSENIPAAPLPSITVLKPVKGLDSQTAACFESWFLQEFPGQLQILFGVASSDDPVCGLVRELIAKHPGVDAELVICQPLLGPNAKVSSLCHLTKRAKHGLLVVSDADVRVNPKFLQRFSNRFSNRFKKTEVGMVNCFYLLAGPKNFAMRWEALAVNADFWTQVLQGIALKPMDFALGAVMGLRRETLDRIGGFESLLDYLADDYQLGHRVARSGARLEIMPEPVECRGDEMSLAEVWAHQLRWSRTIRVCQPVPYFFSILSNATLWPLLLFVTFPNQTTGSVLTLALFLRGLTALLNYQKLTSQFRPWVFWTAWIKDILHFLIWTCSFLGDKITWRGQKFRVTTGGKLIPLA